MKKYISIILLITTPAISFACDICGCGAGNTYIGILPEFSERITGARYRYNSLTTHLGVGGINTYLTTEESYHTLEWWGAWNIRPKFRLMATMPYSFNAKTNQGTTTRKNGLGDGSLMTYYRALQESNTMLKSKLLVQSLWLGAGLKLPTGKYNPADNESTNNGANLFQLGTGSVDIHLSAMYDIRLQDAGINFTTNYKIATSNSQQYRYGNKWSNTLQAYYKFSLHNKWVLAPNAGLQYENAMQDHDKGFDVAASGGSLLLGSVGAEVNISRIAAGLNFQAPFAQHLGSGIVKAQNRMMAHLAIIF